MFRKKLYVTLVIHTDGRLTLSNFAHKKRQSREESIHAGSIVKELRSQLPQLFSGYETFSPGISQLVDPSAATELDLAPWVKGGYSDLA